jgi:omega-6 fatty acid desaturase (delta-12 desaturase)
MKRKWQALVQPYEHPTTWKSVWQLVNSVLPFLVCWALACRLARTSTLGSLFWCALGTGFLLRIYIIQHDCGHGSFFASRRTNDVVGCILSAVTWIPYFRWRHDHAIHHATSGNLARRGRGDVWTMTVREYERASASVRLRYRLYRNPLVLFGVAPLFLFLVLYRLPAHADGRREIRSVHLTNLTVVLLVLALGAAVGFREVLVVHGPVLWMASTVAVWLFYVQHQFEGSYWAAPPTWDHATEALKGSSFLILPPMLQWFSGNIGLHHVHHLSARIPNYELTRCMAETPELQRARVVTLREGLRCLSLKLWDEDASQLVGWDRAS